MDYPIIDDSTDMGPLKEKARGLNLTSRPRSGFAYGKAATPFPDALLIPQNEWADWIADAVRNKATPLDMLDDEGVPCKDQSNTNYCWINAPVHAIEVARCVNGEKYRALSPASAGAPMKRFRNVGGWGKEAVEYLSENGCNYIEDWPANAIDRRYDTTENKEKAKENIITEWIELEPRNLQQHFSLLLRGIPVAVGLNYWGHEVLDIWLEYDNRLKEFQPVFDNSWGNWGNKGRGKRAGGRRQADDAVSAIIIKG